MDALAGQLRSSVELASHATPEGLAEFERTQSQTPWTLRLRGSLATLRANLTFESAAFRHAVRLAACVAVAAGIGRAVSWHRTYWLPMTVAIVLKPDFTATFSRGVLRVAGTLAGLAFATVLFHLFSTTVITQIVLIGLLTFVLRSYGAANYGILTAAVSALVVLLIGLTGVSAKDVIAARAINSVSGGALALGRILAVADLGTVSHQRKCRAASGRLSRLFPRDLRSVSQTGRASAGVGSGPPGGPFGAIEPGGFGRPA